MRIGLFSDTYPPFINGVSTSVAMLKKALENEGHDVYVVTVANSASQYSYEEEDHVIRIPGIPVGIYDYRFSYIYPLKVINLMKSWNLDVIHSNTEFGTGIFARLFAKHYNIPLVHTYHTLYEDYTHYITKGYFEKSSKKIFEYLTKFYCDKTATELIVPTNKIYKLFKEKYKYERNIHIIPTGIEVERFFLENIDKKKLNEVKKKLPFTRGDFVIIFVGRLAKEKNVEFLLNIMPELIKFKKNIKLLIVGDGPDKNILEEKAEELKIAKNVYFNGKAAWEDMPYYYHAANAFITPSTTETQGLTVIEAMAAEICPLCIYDESFVGTVTNDLNGLFFEDEKECVKIIKEVYTNTKKRKYLAHQARVQAEHCSSKAYAQNVLRVYKRALLEKKRYRYGLISKVYEKLRGDSK